METAEHPIADAHARHGVACGEHRAHELVPDHEAGLHLDAAVIDVEVGAADAGRLHAHDGVVGHQRLGLGPLLDRYATRLLECDGPHLA